VVSPGYTPREQMEGKAVPQSDFFALGRTFIYLLTGKPPNLLSENPRTGQLMWQDSAPHLSQPVVDLIDYLIKPFPGQRPHNAQEILQLITKIEKNDSCPQSTFTVVQVPEQDKINIGLVTTDRKNSIASHIEKRNKRIKQGVIGVLASYGLAIAFNSHMTNFMAFFNIIITGLGSLLICGIGLLVCSVSAIFLPFITTAGLTGYFFFNQHRYSSAFTLFWTALNLFDSAAVIKGTRSIEIMVEDENVRDYFLISLGWLQQAPLIGGLLHFIAFVILLLSIAVGFYSIQQEAPKERIVR
ncbi:MAG TPA: hypothetical protein V6D33_17190, partial [Cyanophyceae cyanobacterium]